MEKPRKMNVRLLRRIQKRILEEPKQLYMGAWFTEDGDDLFKEVNGIRTPIKIPNCGTAACVAGWATALSKGINPKQAKRYSAPALGMKALNLSYDQAKLLFHTEYWPMKYRLQLERCSAGSGRAARVTVDRIDHFIKTNGKE